MMIQTDYVRKPIVSKALSGVARDVHYGVVRFGSKPVRGSIYFLHGGNSDDRQGVEIQLPALIQGDLARKFESQGIQLVLPFVGKSFLTGAYSHHFFDEVIPTAEAGTTTTDQSRWIIGLSMGGQAALNAFLRFPNRFRGTGVHFPTLVDFDFTCDKAAQSFSARKNVGPDHLKTLLSDLRDQFKTRDEFFPYDPIALAKKTNASRISGKKIYFDVGSDDEFGLSEGAQSLHQILNASRVPHQFELVHGGRHDGPFVVSQFEKLLRFLLL